MFDYLFGVVVAAIIYSISHISQSHLNPAVALRVWRSGFFLRQQMMPDTLTCDLSLSTAASTPRQYYDLGSLLTLVVHWLQSLILETIPTFILTFVILGTRLERFIPIGFASMVIGLTVGLKTAFMGLIISGMNPAPSLKAVRIGHLWQHQWMYCLKPVLGSLLAIEIYRHLSNRFKDISLSEQPISCGIVLIAAI